MIHNICNLQVDIISCFRCDKGPFTIITVIVTITTKSLLLKKLPSVLVSVSKIQCYFNLESRRSGIFHIKAKEFQTDFMNSSWSHEFGALMHCALWIAKLLTIDNGLFPRKISLMSPQSHTTAIVSECSLFIQSF